MDLALQSDDDIEGKGISYVFLSSDPNVLVQRLEVLIGENLSGNKNSINEASAILNELLTQNEINQQEYTNGMQLFCKFVEFS